MDERKPPGVVLTPEQADEAIDPLLAETTLTGRGPV